MPSSILWRRLDLPGHDACRLLRAGAGWRLEGLAAFRHADGPAALAYALDCDDAWRTRGGVVTGWVGERAVDLRVARGAHGAWTLGGRAVAGLEDCVDLDLGFTPATNLAQLRRVALVVGEAADVPVAWLDAPWGGLERLEQRYERRAEDAVWYTAPRFEYAATLRVDAAGFVRDYPGLWVVEPETTRSEEKR